MIQTQTHKNMIGPLGLTRDVSVYQTIETTTWQVWFEAGITHSLMYLDTWSPVGSIVWGGLERVALLEKVNYAHRSRFTLSAACWWFKIGALGLLLQLPGLSAAMPPPSDEEGLSSPLELMTPSKLFL